MLPDQPELLAKSLAGLLRTDALGAALRPVGAEGTPAAREAAADLLRTSAWAPEPRNILCAGSGRQALAAAVATLVPPGQRLGVEELTYPVMKSIAGRLGVELIPLPVDESGVLPSAVRILLRWTRCNLSSTDTAQPARHHHVRRPSVRARGPDATPRPGRDRGQRERVPRRRRPAAAGSGSAGPHGLRRQPVQADRTRPDAWFPGDARPPDRTARRGAAIRRLVSWAVRSGRRGPMDRRRHRGHHPGSETGRRTSPAAASSANACKASRSRPTPAPITAGGACRSRGVPIPSLPLPLGTASR